MKKRIGWFALAVAGTALVAHAQPYETCTLASGSAGVGPGSYPFTTVGATNDGGAMPACAWDPANNPDVWLKYTATSTGQALLTPADCDFAPFSVSVYSACGGTELGCTADICFEDSVGFSVVAGESYIIRIADYSVSFSEPAYSTGSTLVISEPVPPDNDTCGTAAPIAGPGTYNIVFEHATTDATVLSCAGSQSGVRDVWYSYTAAMTGNAIFEFRSGNANTTFGVFDECGGTLLACDAGGYPNRAGLPVVAEHTYLLRIALKTTSTSDADRSLTVTEYAAPSNDTCGSATSIAVGVTNWDNTGAIASLDENDGSSSSYIWYVYTPGSDGTALFHAVATNANNKDTHLAAYSGCISGQLAINNNIGDYSNRNAGSYIAVPATTGDPIYIRLGIVTESNNTNYYSNGTLTVSLVTPVANDECAGATTIAPGVTEINNRDALTGSVLSTQCSFGTTSIKDVWYKWTPNTSGPAIIHTCSSYLSSTPYVNRNTIISVYAGTCNEYDDFVCNSDDGESHDPPCSPGNSGYTNSYVQFNAVAGTTYYIRVASEDVSYFGLARLTLEFTCAADFNGVNGVTVQDIFDFLTAWLSGNSSANFNGVNGVTVQDIFDFLTAWLAGC